MFDSSNTRKPNTSGTAESDWDETITLIVTGLAKGLGILIWWSVLFPMIGLPLVVSFWLGFQYAPILGLLIAAASGSALAAWAYLSPNSFEEWVTARMRSRWRTWWIYRH